MKKLAFVFAAFVAVALASCGNKAQQAEAEETAACECPEGAKCGGQCEECTCTCDADCDSTKCEGQCSEECAETECAEAPAAE